jgi:hypothetical protein
MSPVSKLITVVTSLFPPTTGKAFKLEPHGALTKRAVAEIIEGRAVTIEVETAAEMVKVLGQTTESRNQAIILSAFNNDDAVGEPFRIMTEETLAERLGQEVGEDGVYRIKGKRMAARVKRGMQPSKWILIDADNPEGISEECKALTLGERLERLEQVLPGISTCERIEYRSSSARVVNGSREPGGPTHALIRVSDPSKIDTMREYLKVATVNAGLSFLTPRHSRKEPDKIVGQEHRTLIDLSVFVCGRIVFNAKPSVSKAPGYRVADAGIRIANRDGGCSISTISKFLGKRRSHATNGKPIRE